MVDAVQTPVGLVVAYSRHDPIETLKRVENGIVARGMTVFARIDHVAGAHDVGLALPPTTVLIFGSAKAGTPLMQMCDTIGLDLPLKMLVRREQSGQTLLVYDDPVWLAKRHGLVDAAQPIVARMQAALAAIAAEAGGGSR
jgi:uncharacterized protein (DUF302 family)